MSTKSSSSASNATNNINEDNRVQGADQANTLGKNAQLTINNNIPDNLKEVLSDVLGLVKDAGQAVVTASNNSIDKVTKIQDNTNQDETRIYKDLFPIIALSIVGLVAVMVYRRKK